MSENLEQKLLSLAEAAEIRGVSQDYLRILIFRERLKAVKLGRNWHTTGDWLDEYFSKNNGKNYDTVRNDTIPQVNITNISKAVSHSTTAGPTLLYSFIFAAFAVGIFAAPYFRSIY